jgi:hypothetical protein
MRRFSLITAFLLMSCSPVRQDVTMTRPEADIAAAVVMPAPVMTLAAPALRGNAQIAGDILDLAFALESGRTIQAFSRFEGPVTVALTGDVPASAPQDLANLVGRFRAEAGIDIQTTTADASITVEFLPRATMRRAVPNAACFVVPRVSSWAAYTAAKGTADLDWTTLTTRERAAVFIPSDTSPQDVRDCLNEELAQALGPLNDLYRLPDSVFNDDNFHVVLTGFDMLVLRALYQPEIRSGMTKVQMAGVLPGILSRLNGGGGGLEPGDVTPNGWRNAIEVALGQGSGDGARRRAAEQAVTIAMAQGWRDNRMAFSWFALGRVTTQTDTLRAITAFGEARNIYATLPGAAIHVAHVDMQLAAFALSAGQAEEAIAYADRALPVVRGAQNAGLQATLLTIKAEAADMLGDTATARALRDQAAPLARYGFGSDSAIRQRLGIVSALAARSGRG